MYKNNSDKDLNDACMQLTNINKEYVLAVATALVYSQKPNEKDIPTQIKNNILTEQLY